MKRLPSELIIEKNRLASIHPWLVLLDITLVDPVNPEQTSVFHLARNSENVIFNGTEYTAFPFDIEPTKYSSKGEIPSVNLKVSNITRVIQEDLERFNGGVGSTVKVIVVNVANLEANYADLEMEFDVTACSTDAQWVVFTLGAPNPLRQRFPLERHLPAHCPWRFKGAECGYNGELATCHRTYEDCIERGMQANFGGFMGLRSGGIRVI